MRFAPPARDGRRLPPSFKRAFDAEHEKTIRPCATGVKRLAVRRSEICGGAAGYFSSTALTLSRSDPTIRAWRNKK